MALPNELLHVIFQQLEKSDLKKASLVCSWWAEVTAEFLFDRVFLTPRRKDVEVFQTWTASKRCSAAIKEIVVPTTFLDRTLSLTEYSKLLYERIVQEYFWPREGLDACDSINGCDDRVAELLHHASHQMGWEVNTQNLQRLRDRCNESDTPICNRQRSLGNRNRFDSEHATSTPVQFLDYDIVRQGYVDYILAAEQQDDLHYSENLRSILVQGFKCLHSVTGIRFSGELEEKAWCPMLNFTTLQPTKINTPPFERV